MQTTIKCNMCLVNTPVHLTERITDQGKRITVCQYCITDEENDLARRFARLSGVNYNRLMEV